MDLIGYLSNGFPSEEETINRAIAYIEGGCDVIEIDLPSNNPYIDGEMIQTRMKASYQADPSLHSHAQTIRKIRTRFPKQKMYVLAYEETIINFGVGAFIRLLQDCNVEIVILVAQSDRKVKQELEKNGIKVASYIRSHLPDEDIQEAQEASGFLYLQVTASEQTTASQNTLSAKIDYLRRKFGSERAINCGVGIYTPEDVKMVKDAGADGVFVGSTILRIEDDHDKLIKWMKELKVATI